MIICFLSGYISAQEQDSMPPAAEAYVDSLNTGHYRNMNRADSILSKNPVTENTLYPKKFRNNIPKRYKGAEFDYSTTEPRESFLQKLLRKIDRILQGIFGQKVLSGSANTASILIRLFAIILVGLLLYFIIRYILGKNGNFFFSKKNRNLHISQEELHENIHEINFPESIAGFERAGDFRSAVRYQFLFVLKKLSDKKLVVWNPEKTNKDYVSELKAPHIKNDFFNLSYIFDYVWYGEFNIDEESYMKFKKQYQSFNP
ncbi:DUF4129 domain-containing protein [Chryseobacterium sp. SORGH_AS_1175]|uniref:DUF4129 domain-containing protein n=1 Tax=Chryseobacterium sp. SORGH_AS_1175 TaxID=3041760 RepID=UPI00286C6AFE|nr:DUF4129 domain-containing protein [Chryseobacterium sp. SORGH_AS_1175]